MKKLMSLALAMALTGMALAGCGSKTTEPAVTGDGVETEAPKAQAEETKEEKAALDYPKNNVNVVVQYSAGGPTDLSVRSLLDTGAEQLPSGVTFAVSNVTGGSGLIGVNQFANSKNDGYTLGVINIDLAINYALGRTELNPADFEPLSMALADPYALLVGADVPYDDIKGFVEYAKANPGKVVVGDSGLGSAPYLAAVAIEKEFGLDVKHVSFDGTADIITAVANKTVDVMFIQPGSALSQIQAGNIKMLAVLSDDRMTTYPDVPTAKEAYPDLDFQIIGWVCLAAPKGTPAEIVDYLKEVLGGASVSEQYAETLNGLNMQAISTKPEELPEFIKAQVAFYQEMCKDIEVE
ncbi:tripartite tricarboxylate transporter substrate binding protein [Clostridium transplantifaecale]|uniref:tripartite tricarboxylate transporter substrate binding protein n=1 Tax=Clostridium transplantifaecale TaxID=2479838 RepID=UPI000F63FB73|nr:tripartite tricarboxylate transporter substrate binding protein [Clostridium transplantifaecale]